jgi:tellurite resistance protein TehA-like permease
LLGAAFTLENEELGPAAWIGAGILGAAACIQTHCGSAIANLFISLRQPILHMAIGLVVFTVIVAGFFIHWILPSMPLAASFALAAILSPTDADSIHSPQINGLTRRKGLSPSSLEKNPNQTVWHLTGNSEPLPF